MKPRLQDLGPYRCGVLLCTTCGTVVKCGCGKEDLVHITEHCSACPPPAPAPQAP